MTFCLGIKVNDGLIAFADTQIVKGDERLSKAKLSMKGERDGHWWIMTSGLRSIRDKAMIYLEEEATQQKMQFGRLYEIANMFGRQLRRVRSEDGDALAASNFAFNLHAIIGGKLANDLEPCMYYIYPEGNWIESNPDSPYFIVGRTPYAKPILDQLLTSNLDIRHALTVAFLAFDATRSSVTDVGFPIDVILTDPRSNGVVQSRFDLSDLASASEWWRRHLVDSLAHFPTDCFRSLFTENRS